MPKEFRTSQSLDSADDFEIQCPAWDMIMAAKETDKLRQLAEEIDKLQLPDDKAGNNFIGVAALKTMLAIAVENDQVARAQLGEIFSKVVAVEAEAKGGSHLVRDQSSRLIGLRRQYAKESFIGAVFSDFGSD